METNHVNPGPFVLASVLTGYPDADFQESVGELLKDRSIVVPEELRTRLLDVVQDKGRIDDLRSEYISVFDQSKSLNPLYETEYGRERAMFKARELSDIAGFYLAFGFQMDGDAGREMVDHVSVELEFYSLLQMKSIYLEQEGVADGHEIVREGMKKFLSSHLGRFVPAILERDGIKNSDFYSQVFAWVNEIVSRECVRLEVQPERVGWFDSQVEDEKMCCGGSAVAGN
ncbi:MAG: hypothetical protein HC902_06565 [Calothrix sp. SM1_5_4]|nr:hypothetical protein [Calothrix sp. SM1_5_4]